MRVTQADSYAEQRDSISHDWIIQLDDWGMIPLLIPNSLSEPSSYLDRLAPDLLILTGGDDLGKTPERDRNEANLLQHAIKTDLPVLGICRGLQLINLYFSGHSSSVANHVATRHAIDIHEPLSTLYGNTVHVNSYHSSSIPKDGLGDGLIAAGFDKDGMIEAALHEDKPIAGIMWHPERAAGLKEDGVLLERLALEGAFWQ